MKSIALILISLIADQQNVAIVDCTSVAVMTRILYDPDDGFDPQLTLLGVQEGVSYFIAVEKDSLFAVSIDRARNNACIYDFT